MKTDRIIQVLLAALIGYSFSQAFRQIQRNADTASRLFALEREVAELRAQSRANVMRALPESHEQKLTLTIP